LDQEQGDHRGPRCWNKKNPNWAAGTVLNATLIADMLRGENAAQYASAD